MLTHNDQSNARRRGMSRRQFIGAAGAIAGATALFTTPLGSLLANFIRPDPLVALHAAGFTKFVKQTFRVQVDGQVSSALQLAEVQLQRAPAAGGECFALIFDSLDARALTQNTYRVEHHALGTFALFIVPTTAQDQTRYVAVINRLSA